MDHIEDPKSTMLGLTLWNYGERLQHCTKRLELARDNKTPPGANKLGSVIKR